MEIWYAMKVKYTQIVPETLIQRRDDILFNTLDKEVVMLSIENGEYYGMDEVGSHIWEILAKPIKLKELVEILQSEYEVSAANCKKETLTFLAELEQRNLLKLYT
jgi:hypothetical protein